MFLSNRRDREPNSSVKGSGANHYPRAAGCCASHVALVVALVCGQSCNFRVSLFSFNIKHSEKLGRMDSEFETITVVVGGNDCYSDRLIPDISKNYDKHIKKAKSMSSICPRLDTVDVQRKIELTNTALKNLCDTHSCRFVNNDNFFKLADKTVNDSLLMRDRVHLTWQPSNKLALNLKLKQLKNVCRCTDQEVDQDRLDMPVTTGALM